MPPRQRRSVPPAAVNAGCRIGPSGTVAAGPAAARCGTGIALGAPAVGGSALWEALLPAVRVRTDIERRSFWRQRGRVEAGRTLATSRCRGRAFVVVVGARHRPRTSAAAFGPCGDRSSSRRTLRGRRPQCFPELAARVGRWCGLAFAPPQHHCCADTRRPGFGDRRNRCCGRCSLSRRTWSRHGER